MPRTPRSASGSLPRQKPDENTLREAALRHLARYATTEAGLLRVLHRRIDRWAREVELTGLAEELTTDVSHARQVASVVVAALARSGAVSDTDFASARARNLTRAGRSRLAVAAHLAAKGVNHELTQQVLSDDPDAELAAALILARRRRIGPFRADGPSDDAARHKELGMLARAGFAHAVAVRALEIPPDEAEARILALRR